MRLKRRLLRGSKIRRFLAFKRVVPANVARKALARLRQLRRRVASDVALIESLNRYINALEGRDCERINRIEELKKMCCESLETINELREHLSGNTRKNEGASS